ncbi:MAG: serine/threonine-protein kinase [Nannocystaceae bacterium]
MHTIENPRQRTLNKPAMRSGRRFGPYRLVRRIARGGFGSVFVAVDTRTDVEVALKVPLTFDTENLSDFYREIELVERLGHANLLPLLRFEVVGSLPVASYSLGRELLDARLTRRVTKKTATTFAAQLLAGLAEMHRCGILHCDIKPDNLVVFPNQVLRIGGFGLAVDFYRDRRKVCSGTAEYMAPECARGWVSRRSDVFSAALVIYELFTGQLLRRPFDWPATGYKRLNEVAPGLGPVLQQALSRDPAARFADAGAFEAEFNRVVQQWGA